MQCARKDEGGCRAGVPDAVVSDMEASAEHMDVGCSEGEEGSCMDTRNPCCVSRCPTDLVCAAAERKQGRGGPGSDHDGTLFCAHFSSSLHRTLSSPGLHLNSSSAAQKRGRWGTDALLPAPQLHSAARAARGLGGALAVMQPAQLAVVLQALHLSKILMARKASRIFREACHYIFRLNLSELSIDWNGVNIASNLFPIFGCPLTLVGMSASRSIKMRQMKILIESGRVRIESLIVKWHLYGARNRLKKLGDLVKSTSLRSLDLSGYEDTYIAYTININ